MWGEVLFSDDGCLVIIPFEIQNSNNTNITKQCQILQNPKINLTFAFSNFLQFNFYNSIIMISAPSDALYLVVEML